MSIRSTFAALVGLALILVSPPIRADTVSFTDTLPTTQTNFSTALVFNKFDATQGTLTSVTFTINGTVTGVMQFENQSPSPSTVTTTLSAVILLDRPDGSNLVGITPSGSQTYSVTAYDGVLDFGGTSGRTNSGLTGTAGNILTTMAASDLALFSSTTGGVISLPIMATATSNYTGSGNIAEQTSTRASAQVTVTYNFTPSTGSGSGSGGSGGSGSVPEPSSLVLMMLGVVPVAMRIRRARSNTG